MKGRQPKARARPTRAVTQTRATSGKHIFAARPKGRRPSRIYSRIIRNWKRVPARASGTDRDSAQKSWIQAARCCRDELLCAGAAGGGGAEETPSFLIPTEDNPRADNSDGGRVVFTCRSHSSKDNYRCRAAWQFIVLDVGNSFFDVSALEPSNNAHEEIATEEYVAHRQSMLTRHFAGMAMNMGETACAPAEVSELAIRKGSRVRRAP